MTDTTELDKILAVKDESQKLGYFLEWLAGQGIVLCRWHDAPKNEVPHWIRPDTGIKTSMFDPDAIENPEWDDSEEGYFPERISIENLLALYYNIDLKKADDERWAILEEIRRNNA